MPATASGYRTTTIRSGWNVEAKSYRKSHLMSQIYRYGNLSWQGFAPKCRRILVKYKVGRNIPFKIDRCGNCAGVWLDENEWETLKSRNLHDEINKIFTDHWQEKIKQEETREALRTIYEQKFGLEDYKKIRAFKTWINSHEKSGEILAYIRDKNPLQF